MTNILHANFMNEFTKNINLISDIDLWNTPNNLHQKLWNYINQLSHFKNKLELIENWEYKDAFYMQNKRMKMDNIFFIICLGKIVLR